MRNTKSNLENKLSTKDLLIGLIGLSPIPIAGEICGTYFFKRIIDNTPLPNKGVQGWVLAAAVTGLTRIGMYGWLYEKIINYLSN